MNSSVGTDTKVLVVDDDALVRTVVRLALERVGHQVVEACDAIDAVNKTRQFDPSIAVLDVHLPNSSVREVIKSLRGERQHLGILLLSGDAEAPSGVTGTYCLFSRKPIDLDVLTKQVEHLAEVVHVQGP